MRGEEVREDISCFLYSQFVTCKGSVDRGNNGTEFIIKDDKVVCIEKKECNTERNLAEIKVHGHGKWEWACIGENKSMVVSRKGEGLMQNVCAWKGRKLKSEIP